MSDKSLSGAVAIVTGASRGIGKGIALELGAAGATVYATARSAVETDHPLPGTVGQTAAEVNELGGVGIGVQCDHRDDGAVRALFDRVLEEQHRLDVLVNNAFIVTDSLTSRQKFWEIPLSDWDDMIDVGTRSAFVASSFAAPPMIEQGRGLIVNVSSSGATDYAWSVPYGVGKCALDRLTADTALEIEPHGVAVVSLWPGLVKTERIDVAEASGLMPAELDFSDAESPRFCGRAVVALATNGAADLTGQAVSARALADRFGFTDVDGRVPPGPLEER